MTNYGFIITKNGWELLSKAASGGNKIVIDSVVFGKGRASESLEGENLALFTQLVDAVAEGTFSKPIIETQFDIDGETVLQKTIQFICEYRSDFTIDGVSPSYAEHFPAEIDYDFYISEFGIYAHIEYLDDNNVSQSTSPVLMYYASLEATPHPVTTYAKGAIDVRRYPVSIVISSDADITLSPLPLAFVTHDEMVKYIDEVARPDLILPEDTMPYVDDEHNQNYPNSDKIAHEDIRAMIQRNLDAINEIMTIVGGDATSYNETMSAYSSTKLVHGIYNVASQRLQF